MNDIAVAPSKPSVDRNAFLLSDRLRLFLIIAASMLTILSAYAVGRWLLGYSLLQPRSIAVVIHIATVLPAIPLGAYVLLSRKGGRRHRLLGRIWLVLMTVTATSTIFIRGHDGNFSPIHFFTVLTFVAVPTAFLAARRGDIAAHRKHMIEFYIGALVIAGLTSFIPGRTMWHWAFG